MASPVALPIERTWRGELLPRSHRARIEAALEGDALVVRFSAPYFDDPEPREPRGVLDGLWDYEVIELFVAGPGSEYLEIELGPHGHHLVLQLSDVRLRARSGLPIDYDCTVSPLAKQALGCGEPCGRSEGVARVPRSYLPERVTRANAYLIHGVGAARCHHAHAPVPGEQPDFHRLACFVPCVL